MAPFDPHQYGPVFAELLDVNRARALDQGTPETKHHAALNALSVNTAFAHEQVVDQAMARCCVAGAWLVCDYLDESHKISQGIDTPSGSFWHAIMHRRECDYSNAKYWFHQVGVHPVYALLAKEGGDREWDPYVFVDECQQAARRSGGEAERLQQLQQREWEVLFDYCYNAAIGR